MKKIISICLVFILVLCISSCGGNGSNYTNDTIELEKTDWRTKTLEPCDDSVTFMVYVVGSNLESKSAAATNDMKEMAQSGIDLSNANVIVYTGGCSQWHSDIPADKNAILELTDSSFTIKDTFEVQSMGDPSSLTRFLDYTYSNYKTDSYCLVLWDHGSGPIIGYGSDSLYENDGMSLPELNEALKNSPFGLDNKLSFIGFDACLMSSCELVCSINDYAEYLIASQETEPAYGWDYSFLSKCGKITTKSMAEIIIDSYSEYYIDYYENSQFSAGDITLSAIDLSYANELEDSVNLLFSNAINGVSGSFKKLVVSRVAAKALGRASTGSEYDLIDLKGLADEMVSIYPNEAKNLADTIEKSIVYNRTNTTGLSGLSFYYPFYNKSYYEKYWAEQYREIGVFEKYCDYLDRYSKLWLPNDTSQFAEVDAPEKTGDITYSLNLTDAQADNLADASYYILKKTGNDEYKFVYISDNVDINGNKLTANFDGKVIYLNDVSGEKYIIPMHEKGSYGNIANYYTTGTIERKDDSLADKFAINFKVDCENDKIDMSAPFLIDESTDIQEGKHEELDLNYYTLIDWNISQHRVLTRDDYGTITDFYNWVDGSLYTAYESYAGDGFDFSYEPMYDDGCEYFIAFRLCSNNSELTMSEMMPITLAKAPTQNEPEVTELSWNGNSTGVIPNIECADISFSANYNYENALQYNVDVKNKTDEKINVWIGDFSADGVYFNRFADISVDPGEEKKEFGLDDIARVNVLNKLSSPKSIYFTLYIHGERQTYVPNLRYHITINPFNPVLNCDQAEKQTVFNENGLKLDLLKFLNEEGSNAGYEIDYKLANLSSENKVVKLRIIANGIPVTKIISVEIKAGFSKYISDEFSTLILEDFDIKNISSLSFEITDNSETKLYPVKLLNTYSDRIYKISNEDKVLYKDDLVEVYEAYSFVKKADNSYTDEPDKYVKIIRVKNISNLDMYCWGVDAENEIIKISDSKPTRDILPGSYIFLAVISENDYKTNPTSIKIILGDNITTDYFTLS